MKNVIHVFVLQLDKCAQQWPLQKGCLLLHVHYLACQAHLQIHKGPQLANGGPVYDRFNEFMHSPFVHSFFNNERKAQIQHFFI